ncbi:uncharacterized protein LOC113305309 [Papaver somniferum]|uniref:uncharacterized protein LOC113305309 n=1 Tax=Papaver somniferum TaxID=3469 RepID=UPI000E6F981B|nr:uncharacterized protein LOC113305309 [Papaver somniferum]
MTLDNINIIVYHVPNNAANNIVSLQNFRWKPPDNGYLKINFDASFVEQNFQGGIGLILRDFAGTCFGVQGQYFNGGMKEGIEVEELECEAMKAVVSLAISRIKRDCNVVADKLEKKAKSLKANFELFDEFPPNIKNWVSQENYASSI